MQTQIGIRELKTRLSHYLQQVKQGETVLITDRGKPIGLIIPYTSSLQEKIENLHNFDWLEWNGKKMPPFRPQVVNKSRPISDLLLEDRE